MNVRAIELLKKLEQTVGTHKLLKCVSLGGIGFLLGIIFIPDEIQQIIENNKEEF